MTDLHSALLAMYFVAGYLYLWCVSPHTTNASIDIRICIWLFWLPLFIWDMVKALGKVLMNILEFILEVFD